MAYQPYPIAPFQTGLDTQLDSYLLPKDAFIVHENGHIKHGRIEKRSGTVLLATMSGGTPVMGLATYYSNQKDRILIGFDQENAYSMNAAIPYAWSLLTGGTSIFTSGNTNFVWWVNWQSSSLPNRLYFSNGKSWDGATDGIFYYDGTSVTSLSDTIYTDSANTNKIIGSQLIFVFKERLFVANVSETAGDFPQRIRWCQRQGPSNWVQDVAGAGGFLDIPTGEHIISGRALQDQIILFCTDSVWSLQYTGFPNAPFKVRKINDFRACDGKMASTQFDRYVTAIGRRGIIAVDGIEVRRIDDKIESFVTENIHADSFTQVFCFRDFNEKRWWTLYPSLESTTSDGSLVYDDDSASWSLYNIDLNVLGSFESDQDWAYSDFTGQYDWEYNHDEVGDKTYQSFFWQGKADQLIGGDTEGNVYQLDSGYADDGEDIDFTLKTVNWNPYEKEGIECQMGYVDFLVESHPWAIFEVFFYKDNDEDLYGSQELDCLPDLGFIVNINQITQANPGVVTANGHGLTTGDAIYMYGVQGMYDANSSTGAYVVTVIDEDSFSIGVDTSGFDAYTKGGQVFQREFYRTKCWKRAYAGGIGFVHQMEIEAFGDNNPLVIHEYKPWFRPRGKRELG